MKVKLISYSQVPPDEDSVTAPLKTLQDIIAYCARVSNPSNQSNSDTADKLIKYLAKNKHWSPFEMVSVCLELTTTRDIARQFLRHRSFSFQEFSQRYADPTKDLNFVIREARLQDSKNRQNSIGMDLNDDSARRLAYQWEQLQKGVIERATEVYTWAIANGIAKEVARAVLPEGNTESKLYVNGTLRSWIHYCSLRMGHGTQKEHADIARGMAQVIASTFPLINNFVSE